MNQITLPNAQLCESFYLTLKFLEDERAPVLPHARCNVAPWHCVCVYPFVLLLVSNPAAQHTSWIVDRPVYQPRVDVCVWLCALRPCVTNTNISSVSSMRPQPICLALGKAAWYSERTIPVSFTQFNQRLNCTLGCTVICLHLICVTGRSSPPLAIPALSEVFLQAFVKKPSQA